MDLATLAAIEAHYNEVGYCRDIHPEDHMWNTGQAHYWSVGLSGVRVVLTGLALTWLQQVERLIDLPCGHGRVARHLRAAFPEAEMFVCDIDRSGVDFCAQAFDCTGIYSEADLTRVALPKDLDVIWVGSLFTHVDRHRVASWLAYLTEHLRDHGIIVATFHGYFTATHTATHNGVRDAKIRRGFHKRGFGYDRYRTVDEGDYGISMSKPSTILDIADAIPGTRVVSYTERGWANNHDVLVLTRNDRLAPMPGPESRQPSVWSRLSWPAVQRRVKRLSRSG